MAHHIKRICKSRRSGLGEVDSSIVSFGSSALLCSLKILRSSVLARNAESTLCCSSNQGRYSGSWYSWRALKMSKRICSETASYMPGMGGVRRIKHDHTDTFVALSELPWCQKFLLATYWSAVRQNRSCPLKWNVNPEPAADYVDSLCTFVYILRFYTLFTIIFSWLWLSPSVTSASSV